MHCLKKICNFILFFRSEEDGYVVLPLCVCLFVTNIYVAFFLSNYSSQIVAIKHYFLRHATQSGVTFLLNDDFVYLKLKFSNKFFDRFLRKFQSQIILKILFDQACHMLGLIFVQTRRQLSVNAILITLYIHIRDGEGVLLVEIMFQSFVLQYLFFDTLLI